jgi:hypothetical protein
MASKLRGIAKVVIEVIDRPDEGSGDFNHAFLYFYTSTDPNAYNSKLFTMRLQRHRVGDRIVSNGRIGELDVPDSSEFDYGATAWSKFYGASIDTHFDAFQFPRTSKVISGVIEKLKAAIDIFNVRHKYVDELLQIKEALEKLGVDVEVKRYYMGHLINNIWADINKDDHRTPAAKAWHKQQEQDKAAAEKLSESAESIHT